MTKYSRDIKYFAVQIGVIEKKWCHGIAYGLTRRLIENGQYTWTEESVKDIETALALAFAKGRYINTRKFSLVIGICTFVFFTIGYWFGYFMCKEFS